MALIRKNLVSHQMSPSFRTAYYQTDDTQAAVRAANYFNEDWSGLPKNTVLTVVAEANTAAPKVCMYVVTASAAAGVTIALQVVV